MEHSNPNLTATLVTDKNGRLTTVHKKRDSPASMSRANVPAPTLGAKAPRVTNASRLRGISDVFIIENKIPNKAKVKQWLAESTPEQLDALDDALESFASATRREKYVLSMILDPLTYRTGYTEATHELIRHRQAFTSEWAISNNPVNHITLLPAFVYGARQQSITDFKTALDCTDENAVRENIALLRFAYELQERATYGGFLPIYKDRVAVSDAQEHPHVNAYVYDDPKLKDLIKEYADRVDDLIEFSITQKTSDPYRLRALLEHEGHSTLVYGML